MNAELDRVAYLLEEASKSITAGQPDEAGNQLCEARGILEQTLEAVAPALLQSVVPGDGPTPIAVERNVPAA